MIGLLWALISKVFVFVLIGALVNRFFSGKGEKAASAFIWFALYVLIPVYMFLTVWVNPLNLTDTWKIAACAMAVILSGALLAWLWAKAQKISFRAHCLPVIFMNSAYLAIPVSTLLWGPRGAAYAIVYNVVVTVINFTLGIWWVAKGNPITEIAGLPVLYAVAAGIALNFYGVAFPPILEAFGGMVSFVTLPVMLIFVGYRLGQLKSGNINLVLWGVALRMGGGLVSGAAAIYLLGIRGPAAGVCLMASSMPSAVFSYILTEKYRGNAPFAAATVFAGTVLSFFTIALLGYLLK